MDKVTAERIAINYTKSIDRQAQANAGAFLAQSDSPEALEAVSNLLRDEDEYVRGTTLFAFLEGAPVGLAGARKVRSLPFPSLARLGWLTLGVFAALFAAVIVAAVGLRMTGPLEGWEPEFLSAFATTMLVVTPLIVASRPTGLYPRPVSALPLELIYLAGIAAVSGVLATLFALSPVIGRGPASAITIGAITLIVCLAVRIGAAAVVILTGKRSAPLIAIFMGALLLGVAAIGSTVPLISQFEDTNSVNTGRLLLFGGFAVLAASIGIAIVEQSIPARLKRAESNIGSRARQAVGLLFVLLAVFVVGRPLLSFTTELTAERPQPFLVVNGRVSAFNETSELSASIGEPIQIELRRPATIEARGEFLRGGDIVARTYLPFEDEYRRTDMDPAPSVEEVSEDLMAPELGRLIFDSAAEPYRAYLCFAEYSQEEACPQSYDDINWSQDESLNYSDLLRSFGQRFGGDTEPNAVNQPRNASAVDVLSNTQALEVSFTATSEFGDDEFEEAISWLVEKGRFELEKPEPENDGDPQANSVLSAVFVGNERYSPGFWLSDGSEPQRIDVPGLPFITQPNLSGDLPEPLENVPDDDDESDESAQKALTIQQVFFEELTCLSLQKAASLFRMSSLASDEETLCDRVVDIDEGLDEPLQDFLNASLFDQQTPLTTGDLATVAFEHFSLALGEPVEILDAGDGRGTTLVRTFSPDSDGGQGLTYVQTSDLAKLRPLEGQSDLEFLEAALNIWRALVPGVERTAPLQRLSNSERQTMLDQIAALGIGLVPQENLSIADAAPIGFGLRKFSDLVGANEGSRAAYLDLGGSSDVRALSIRLVSKSGDTQPSVSFGQPSYYDDSQIDWSETVSFDDYNPQNMTVLTNSAQKQYLGVFNYGGPGEFEVEITEVPIETLSLGVMELDSRDPNVFRLPAPDTSSEVLLRTSNIGDIDTVIDVYDSSDLINTYAYDDDGGNGYESSLTVYQRPGQSLIVKIRNISSSEGSYTLTVR
ncbi:MAG: DMT family transporter [Pseudomonadota bacterium]